MMFLSHVLFSILSGYGACSFLGCSNELLFIAIAAVASIVPDIDHVSSFIGRRLPPFSLLLNFFFKHRGLLHSFLPLLPLFFILSRILTKEIATAVVIGYSSHLILDATTVKGIRPLYPLKLRIRGFIRTNSFAEKLVTLLLLIIVIIVIFSKTIKFLQ